MPNFEKNLKLPLTVFIVLHPTLSSRNVFNSIFRFKTLITTKIELCMIFAISFNSLLLANNKKQVLNWKKYRHKY